MVAAGEPDGPIEAFRGAMRCYSLHAFAKMTLAENPRLHLTPHTERVFPAPRNGVSAGSEGYGAVVAP